MTAPRALKRAPAVRRDLAEAGKQQGRAPHVKKDLAEATRRAATAKTPVARKVTAQVLEAKRRTYSGEAPQASAAPRKAPALQMARTSKRGRRA